MILKSQKYFTLGMVHKLNPKRGSQLRYSHGLTLIEVMVVAAIIGIMMVIAIPSFTGMQKKAQVSAAAKEIAQNFKQARERALASANTHQFSFDNTQKTYTASYKILLVTHSKTYKLAGTAGGMIRYGFVGNITAGPPEAWVVPEKGGIDFGVTGDNDSLIFTGHGGATHGVLYVTDGNENYAIGVNELGKTKVYRNSGKNNYWY